MIIFPSYEEHVGNAGFGVQDIRAVSLTHLSSGQFASSVSYEEHGLGPH